MSVHLVTGVVGQDGILLARHLLSAGHTVVGTVRDSSIGTRACYLDGVDVVQLDVRDTDGFARLLASHQPDVVHNLAAFSSVGQSWSEREAVEQVNAEAVAGMLKVIASIKEGAPRFVHASSSEIFGAPRTAIVTATDELHPASPYGESKARAHRAVQKARRDGFAASNLILFGHSGVLHAAHFVLPTIARQAAEVALGHRVAIELQNPAISRDWGAASDFALAFAAAAERPAGDFVIATGTLSRLSDVAAWALDSLHAAGTVAPASVAQRPGDFSGARGDVGPAYQQLGWRARTPLRAVISRMASVAQQRILRGVEDEPAYLAPE